MRPSSSSLTPSKLSFDVSYRTHGCIGVARADFLMMGYSVRIASWRYTAWLPWVGANLTGAWTEATPIAAAEHYTPGASYYREL